LKISRSKQQIRQRNYPIRQVIYQQKQEDYSPSFGTVLPKVMMGLELFTWRTLMVLLKAGKFGQWYSSEILTGTTILPEETKLNRALIGDEKIQ
jgi:hypothetical protein